MWYVNSKVIALGRLGMTKHIICRLIHVFIHCIYLRVDRLIDCIVRWSRISVYSVIFHRLQWIQLKNTVRHEQNDRSLREGDVYNLPWYSENISHSQHFSSLLFFSGLFTFLNSINNDYVKLSIMLTLVLISKLILTFTRLALK